MEKIREESKQELQQQLILARKFGDYWKAKDIARKLKEMDNTTEADKQDKEDLENALNKAEADWDREEIERIMGELEKKNAKPTKITDFDNKFQEIKDELAKADTTKMDETQKEEFANKLKDFLQTNVNEYKENNDKIETSKDKQIKKLEDQLKWVLSDEPNLGEYFSLERRRLASLRKRFDDMKSQKWYPKNVLIYAMNTTNRKLFGTRQKIKRWFTKMARKRKSDKIKTEIQKLEEKLQIKPDDSAQRKLTKQFILEQIKEAKAHYLKDIQNKVWL